MKTIIFTNKDRPREYTEAINKQLRSEMGADSQIINLEDLVFKSKEGVVNVIYDGVVLKDIKFAYIKHWHSSEENALIVNKILSRDSTVVIPEETEDIVPKTKFGELFLASMASLPIPDSIYTEENSWYIENYKEIKEAVGTPFIFKSSTGKKGSSNFLINSHEELKKAIANANEKFIAQTFIPNDCDYRIINFDSSIELIIKRTGTGDTHMNNTSLGGGGELIEESELDPIVIEDSIKVAQLLKRNISGVDMVVDKNTGKHYIMEVNYSPQITTGVSTDSKLSVLTEYIKFKMQQD